MNKIILNPIYGIKNDKSCSFIYIIDDSFNTILKKLPDSLEIPSLYGYILSYFKEAQDIEEGIEKIFNEIKINKNSIQRFIIQLLNRNTSLETKYKGYRIILPPNILINEKQDQLERSKVFTEKEFNPLNEFIKSRPSAPAKVTIMITTKCNTDCIYCYADRSQKMDFETNKILSIIKDCYQSGVLNIALSGGDIFAYKGFSFVLFSNFAIV